VDQTGALASCLCLINKPLPEQIAPVPLRPDATLKGFFSQLHLNKQQKKSRAIKEDAHSALQLFILNRSSFHTQSFEKEI
jgi:hypothetical protein